ncbi:MAG TPA: SIMPL domain-containing protein [Streptosporangiaceae bacterium]|nr:SIMPL domain-containing protein [Streptosporangiaceae bacterium]
MTEALDPARAGGPPRSPTVIVRGEATVETSPEIVEFAVSVRARARDRREALANLSRRNDEFLALVRTFGEAIEKTETSGVSVYPELRRGRDEKVRWYRGAVRVRLTVADFSVAGELAGRVSDQEMCELEGPWWGLRPGSPVYREARLKAARAAVTRAAEYAEAVGGTLTGLIELADTGMSGRGHVAAFSARARRSPSDEPEDGPAVIDLEPETQVVEAAVEARFSMTQPSSLGA